MALARAVPLAVVAAIVVASAVFPLNAGVLVPAVVNARVDAMDRMAVALKAFLPQNAAQADTAALQASVHEIETLAAGIPDAFPVGSGVGQTNARPEIWTNWPAFDARATALQEEASALQRTVEGGDLGAIIAEGRRVRQACSDCHDAFRYPQN